MNILNVQTQGEKAETVVTGDLGGQNRFVARTLGMISRNLSADWWQKHVFP